jgi:phosphatidylglycerophosphatase A
MESEHTPVAFWKKIVTAIASGFGLGYSPFASGTVGSIWGVVIVLGLAALNLSLPVYIVVCIALTVLAIPICQVAEQVFQKKDDGRIVADEFLTFPICVIGLTPYFADHWWLLPFAFCTNRFFDIIKLPPADQMEHLSGGVGITLDDAAASFYSLIANWAAFLLFTRLLIST